MYNQSQYNQTKYNANPEFFPSGLTADAVRFNGFGFYQNGKIIIDQPQYDEPANLVVDNYKKPLSDGYGENSQYMGIKNIKIKGILKADDAEGLEALIDELNNELNVSFGNLDIQRATGEYRRFRAKAVSTTGLRENHYNTYWCDFSIDFEVYDGVGKDINVTSSGESVSALAFSGSVVCNTVGKKLQTPADFIVAVNSASNITKCNIKNNTTGDEIEFDVSLDAGDFLFVSASNTECYKISAGVRTNIKPRGKYITLSRGSNNYTVTFTGDSIDYSLTVKYTNLYI